MIRLTTLFSALLMALLLTAAGIKVAIDSRAHFAEGRSLELRARLGGTSRDLTAAADAYARAVRSYVPFFSHGAPALERMHACAQALTARGETGSARRVRAQAIEAAASTAVLYSPYRDQLRPLWDTTETPSEPGS